MHGEQKCIYMMTCVPLTALEDPKVHIREGIAKLCPASLVPDAYGGLQFCLAPGEPAGTHGHYLLVGLQTTSMTHMRFGVDLLTQPDFVQEPPMTTLP